MTDRFWLCHTWNRQCHLNISTVFTSVTWYGTLFRRLNVNNSTCKMSVCICTCSGKQVVGRECAHLKDAGTCKPFKNGIVCFCGEPVCNDEQLDSKASDEYKALDSAASSGGTPGDSPGDSPGDDSQPSDESGGGGSKSASPVMTVDVVIFFISIFFVLLL